MSVPGRHLPSRVYLILGVVCSAALAAVAWKGRTYYALPVPERPLHEAHSALRSSGLLGLPFGIAGYALIILNLGYLLRRGYVHWKWMGSLRAWMSFHVFTGIVGALLVLLHSAFLARSPMGIIASVSLWIVVLTGIVGRFIYAHVPRSVQGQELELSELTRELEEKRRALLEKGVGVQAAQGAAPTPHRGVAAALTAMVEGDRAAAREYEELSRMVMASPELAAAAGEILPLAKRFVKEKQWLSRYEELRDLMGLWRFFHRWFAIVMLAVALCHVLVATGLGGLRTGMP
ncbi:MAG: hypothetical protein PHS14_08565 [Elusimicrobia bacterium]|nr:hypothetical protein [Elusimicrobiota bacterium]